MKLLSGRVKIQLIKIVLQNIHTLNFKRYEVLVLKETL